MEITPFQCPVLGCSGKFTLRTNLTRHLRVQHGNRWKCVRCNQDFSRYENYRMHERICLYKTTGKRPSDEDSAGPSKKRRSSIKYFGGALQGSIKSFHADLEKENQTDIMRTLRDSVMNLQDTIEENIREKHALKFQVCLHANFHLGMDTTIKTVPPPVLKSHMYEVYESSNIR